MMEKKKFQRFKNLDTLFYFFTKYVGFPILKIYHRAERTGIRNVPCKGPFIVMANHASFLDPWYLGIMFRARHVRYLITNKWYKKNRLWTFFFDLYGCIPVTPDDMEPSTIKSVLNILRKGGVVGIFPEGRVCYDGKLQEFSPGAVYIAIRARVPVIPVAICGSYGMLPRDRLVPKPSKLRIVVGEPVYLASPGDGQKNSKDRYVTETHKIRNWIAVQLEQFQNRE